MTAVTTEDLRVAYGERVIVPGLSIDLTEGQITAIVGPNGSGKSTALKAIARLLKPSGGAVYLSGKQISELPTKDVARRLAMLPQQPDIPASVTVEDLVGYGRYPYQGLLGRFSTKDREAIDWAIDVTGMVEFRDRPVDTLSGGERQRAWIAMALAQQSSVLLLDEPTTFLDVRYQIEVLSLVRQLNQEQGLTVGWVLHDLNQAAAYSDHIVMMRGGQVFDEGAPETIVTPATIRNVFEIDVSVIPDPVSGCPTCLFYGACSFTAGEQQAAPPRLVFQK